MELVLDQNCLNQDIKHHNLQINLNNKIKINLKHSQNLGNLKCMFMENKILENKKMIKFMTTGFLHLKNIISNKMIVLKQFRII